MSFRQYTSVALLLLLGATSGSAADSKRDALWAAVRAGDVKAAQAAVTQGADVNARNEYGVSALWIAVGKGKLDVVQFLVRKGADVNTRDDIWYQTPLSGAVGGSQIEMVRFLIKSGAKDVDAAILTAAALGKVTLARLTERVTIQKYEVTVLEAIFHVVEHFAQHTGQIIFVTKMLTGEDLGFYKPPKPADGRVS